MMNNYKKKLNCFLERQVSEMPTCMHSTNVINGYTETYFLFDSGLERKASEILTIQEKRAKTLGVEVYAFILTTLAIERGEVVLTFLLPAEDI